MIKRIFLSLSSVLIGLFTLKTIKIYLIRRRYKHLPGPKTNGIIGFYFGQYFEIVNHVSNQNLQHELHLKWSKLYGSIFKYQVLDRMTVIISNEETVKATLIDEDIPKKPIAAFPLGERFLGFGLLTETDKSKWRHRRQILNHVFKKDILLGNLNEFNSKGDILIEHLKNLCLSNGSSSSLQLFYELNRLTLDIIAKVAFDLDTNCLKKSESKLNLYITKGLEATTLEIIDPLCKFKPNKWSSITNLKESMRKLRKFSIESLTIKLKELKDTQFLGKNVLSFLIQNAKTEEDFDFERLVDDFVTFFIGGQETTANALAFCFLELGQNPEVLKKLREEIDSVLGSKKYINNDDLSKLEYTSAVFKESLRKWPPVASFSRILDEDIELLGYKIPKNTFFLMPVYVMARSEKYFPEPEEFKPERFLKNDPFSSQNRISSYTYMPFSIGPRNCIGQNFAKIEGKLILAKIIQNFDFELDPNQSFKVVQHATLRPIDGVKIFLKPRQ
uniref:Cytochrome p450 CYP3049E5 n=1 Tax=Brachionus calyciflorus TaxID=104777 RepID=A0A2H4PSJ1_9BILA|nr:cytochrome p450 CYP3049E5 [Brachionus calyciflorus]